MVSTLLEMSIDEISQRIAEAISNLEDPVEKLEAVIRVELDYYNENRNINRIMAREVWGYQTKMLDHIQRIRESRATTIERIIQEGIDQGKLKKVEPQTIAAALEGMILATTIYWFAFSDDYPRKQIENNINTLFFQGIMM